MPTLFSGWESIGRVAVVAALGYIALLIMLRVSGKRTIAKMNVFDFVHTVALGGSAQGRAGNRGGGARRDPDGGVPEEAGSLADA